MPDLEIVKPLGRKAYGSIGHLPCSRMGPGDHKVPDGYARICCEKLRDHWDVVIVQEKLDGSCVSVAKIPEQEPGEGPSIVALGRAGYPACTSPYKQHHLFADWAYRPENAAKFHALLDVGERIVGEWLAQAHGTRYDLTDREPFVAFDIMREDQRTPFAYFRHRCQGLFAMPPLVSAGEPLPVERAMEMLGEFGRYGALDPIEGVVYRVERKCKVDFLAKFVRPEKQDGCYLPEVSGKAEVWNWRPR